MYMCAWMYIYICVCIYICMYVFMCVYMYIYLYIYINHIVKTGLRERYSELIFMFIDKESNKEILNTLPAPGFEPLSLPL